MDQERASGHDEATAPIFGAYRRGYDPEQVDRYVADQRRRLDDAVERASEAERRLGAAVGQLRELHRRVAVLESQERPSQAPALDTLGERVQRILNEAWEGAYALRQSAEQEVLEWRQRAELEAAEILEAAEQRVHAAEAELAERRAQQHERLEHERSKAVAQISYLHEQRKLAVTELLRLRDVVESTVVEFMPANAGHPVDATRVAPSVRAVSVVESSAPEIAADRHRAAEPGRHGGEPARPSPQRSGTPSRAADPDPTGAVRRPASQETASHQVDPREPGIGAAPGMQLPQEPAGRESRVRTESAGPDETLPGVPAVRPGQPAGEVLRVSSGLPDLVREHRNALARSEPERARDHEPGRRTASLHLRSDAPGPEGEPRHDLDEVADPSLPSAPHTVYDFEAD